VNDKIELRFKDNGIGIDLEKNSGQLFGLYKRFDTTMEGKGMGLLMVKTKAEALGGTIKIKSNQARGQNL
jgi:signal transduction histidine kinase